MRPPLTAAITLDLHVDDHVPDIRTALERLGERGIRATFFVPTEMFGEARYRDVAREIVRAGHEVGSHGHLHDYQEMVALLRGGVRDLEFLARSKGILEDALGLSPAAFRSPCWCHLGPAAVDTLAALGYTVDSSATPQRLGIFSSTPYENVWTLAPRQVTLLAPTLVEVPTSTFLLPAGTPAFLILRGAGSRALVRLLKMESRIFAGRALTLQFHAREFAPDSTRGQRTRVRLTPAAFLPRRRGGFTFKQRLRSTDAAAMAAVTVSILDMLHPARFLTLSEIAAEWREARD